MTLLEAYRAQYKICIKKGLNVEQGGHYQTRIYFSGRDYYVSPDGNDVIRYKFDITGCLKKAIKRNKTTGKCKVIYFHKDKLPVYGTITRQRNLKGFLYKFILFLRCDGIEDVDLQKLYTLHCLAHHFEFWRKREDIACGAGGKIVKEFKEWEEYSPQYSDLSKMVDGVIKSAGKQIIDKKVRDKFVLQTRCVVNKQVRTEYGGIRNKSRSEKVRDERKGQRTATDIRIKSSYEPTLTDKENAETVGVSLRRFQEWKSGNRDSLETLEQKINRMYNPTLSLRKNAEIISCSVNTLRKYLLHQRDSVPVDPDEAWANEILKEESSRWDGVPTAKQKIIDDDEDWIDSLLDDNE